MEREGAMASEPVVEIENLDFAFGRHPILLGVNLQIQGGDFVSFIGPNGGGKSTLLRIMLGLLSPTRGVVRLLGRSPAAARYRVGYMPQHPHFDDSFPVTALDVVLMGRLGRRPLVGPYRRRDRLAAARALAEVEAADLRDRSLGELSGGERQRVLIARALATDPELLFLDEPTASLDPGVQDELYDLLRELNRRMTILIVSHDVGVVSRHVSKVVCVNVHVDQHPSSEIKGELGRLFGNEGRMRLVRHDRHHSHLPLQEGQTDS
jgi:zinc transport system ATP-binding protein